MMRSDMAPSNSLKDLEEQFIQNARAYAELKSSSVPLPHEEFEPYLSQYTQFDSTLSEALATNVQDLDIPSGGGEYNQ